MMLYNIINLLMKNLIEQYKSSLNVNVVSMMLLGHPLSDVLPIPTIVPGVPASLACSTACKRTNCNNPSGKRPPVINIRKRKRHDLQTAHTKEIVFLQERNENITIGGWSQIETILFIHVIGHIERKGEKATPELIQKVYSELVQYMNDFQLKLAIEQKSLSSIAFKLNALKKLKDSFKTYTQL